VVGNLAIYDLASRREIGLPVGKNGSRPYWFDEDKKLFFLSRFSGFTGVASFLDLDTLVSKPVGIQLSPEAAWKAREWVERIESHEGENPRKEVVFGTFQDVFNEASLSDSRLIQDEWSAVQARMAMYGLEWNIRRTLNGNFPGLWARARNGCSFQQIMTRQVANVRRSPGGERLLWEEQGVGLVAARIRPDVTHDQYLSAGIGRTSGLLAGDLVGIFEGVVNPLNNKLVGYRRAKGFGLVVGVQAENATIRIIGALEPGVGKIGAGDVISLPWGEAWAAVQEAGEPKWDEEGSPRAVIPIWEQLPFIDMGVNGSVSQEVLTYLFKTRADSGRTRYLLQELDNSTTLLRAKAMEAVGRLRESTAVPRLRKELTSHDYQAAPRVVWALGEIGDRASIPVLEDFIRGAARYDNTAIQVLAAKLAIEKLRTRGAPQSETGGIAPTKEANVAIATPQPAERKSGRPIEEVLAQIRQEDNARMSRYSSSIQQEIVRRHNAGRKAMQSGNWGAARWEFSFIVQRYDPENFETHVYLSGIYAMLRDADKAKGHFDVAVKRAPEYALPYVNMVYAYARTGRVDEALNYLERAVELGYKDLSRFRTDVDLPKEFREHPKVQQLVGRRG